MMQARWYIAVIALIGLSLASFTGCDDQNWRQFSSIGSRTMDGQTYLIVDNQHGLASDTRSYYRIFRAQSPDYSRWEPVTQELLGPVFGSFVYQDPKTKKNWLGLFHPDLAVFYRFDKPSSDGPEKDVRPIDFDWHPETAATLNGTLYAFGAERKNWPALIHADPTKRPKGSLCASKFVDGKFEEIKLEGAPEISTGFWLSAIEHQGKIHLFWRQVKYKEQFSMEPPLELVDKLFEAVFDGDKLVGKAREIADLPPGHCSAWSDGTTLKIVVQPQIMDFGKSPMFKMFEVPPDGPLKPLALPMHDLQTQFRFKYFLVEPLLPPEPVALNPEKPATPTTTPAADAGPKAPPLAFIRSNTQVLEFWTPTESGEWTVKSNAAGLPYNDLQGAMTWALISCAFMVLTGIGMAAMKAGQIKRLTSILRPRDVIAPITLRATAYVVDLFVIVSAYIALSYAFKLDTPHWLHGVAGTLDIPVYFFVMYMGYLTLMEFAIGATIGKLLMGLRVVSDQGTRPSFWAAFARNLAGFFERNLFFAFFASLPCMILTPRGQRLGDLMARTIVVQKAALLRYVEQRKAREAAKAKDAEAEVILAAADKKPDPKPPEDPKP